MSGSNRTRSEAELLDSSIALLGRRRPGWLTVRALERPREAADQAFTLASRNVPMSLPALASTCGPAFAFRDRPLVGGACKRSRVSSAIGVEEVSVRRWRHGPPYVCFFESVDARLAPLGKPIFAAFSGVLAALGMSYTTRTQVRPGFAGSEHPDRPHQGKALVPLGAPGHPAEARYPSSQCISPDEPFGGERGEVMLNAWSGAGVGWSCCGVSTATAPYRSTAAARISSKREHY